MDEKHFDLISIRPMPNTIENRKTAFEIEIDNIIIAKVLSA